MTRERAKKLMPIIQALAEGKTIQVKFVGESDDHFRDVKEDNKIDWFNPVYIYRIKQEPKYVPYESYEEIYEDIRKHGNWVITGAYYHTISAIYEDGVRVSEYPDEPITTDFDSLLEDFVWADDGTPCGMFVNAENRAD